MIQKQAITIYVEGPVDRFVVGHVLIAAGLADGVRVIDCKGKANVAKAIVSLRNTAQNKYIALIDADKMSVPDSIFEARQQLDSPQIEVFCAVPTVEAWLFADDKAAMEAARNDHARQQLGRIPLPESIPYPKQLASYVFPKGSPESAFAFLQSINIGRASARCPSLRAFLSGVSNAKGLHESITLNAMKTTLSRDVFSTLLRELPGDSVVWRTLDGTSIRANQLAKDVSEGTEIGKQYISEVLRIARDLIARKSQE